MKWKVNKYMPYERHVIHKFAYFPIRIKNEVRWLEFVNIEAYYWYGAFSGRKYWEYERFID